jgi:cytoskeletal protein CcmA (bactofilin family)
MSKSIPIAKLQSETQPQLVSIAILESVTAFLPEFSIFKGDVEADPGKDLGIRIDCRLEGSVVIPSGGVIHIGPTGSVKGASIEADYIFIEGSVESKIVSRKGVEITGTAVVKGQVEYQGSLNMHNMAKVRASIQYAGPDDLPVTN